MSVDILQDKIRKAKNASVVCFYAAADMIPNHLLQQEQTLTAACGRFVAELLDGLKGVVPAVRFDFASFALLGADGLAVMSSAMKRAGAVTTTEEIAVSDELRDEGFKYHPYMRRRLSLLRLSNMID